MIKQEISNNIIENFKLPRLTQLHSKFAMQFINIYFLITQSRIMTQAKISYYKASRKFSEFFDNSIENYDLFFT